MDKFYSCLKFVSLMALCGLCVYQSHLILSVVILLIGGIILYLNELIS